MPRNKKRNDRRTHRAAAKTVAVNDTATAAEAAARVHIQSANECHTNSDADNNNELVRSECDENAMGDCMTGRRTLRKHKSTSRADPILVILENSTLRTSDAQLLHGPRWLNEAVVNFYMAYLDEIKYKFNGDFLFLTPELTQCLSMMERKQLEMELIDERKAHRKSFIFMVTNDGIQSERNGLFWSLVVASRPDNFFYHFDSYGGNNTENSMELFNSIKDVLDMDRARFRTMRCLQQKNDYDCGIHVMCMVDHIADYVNRFDSVEGVSTVHNDVITGKRNMLIKLISSMDKDGKGRR